MAALLHLCPTVGCWTPKQISCMLIKPDSKVLWIGHLQVWQPDVWEMKILLNQAYEEVNQVHGIFPMSKSKISAIPRENDIIIIDESIPKKGLCSCHLTRLTRNVYITSIEDCSLRTLWWIQGGGEQSWKHYITISNSHSPSWGPSPAHYQSLPTQAGWNYPGGDRCSWETPWDTPAHGPQHPVRVHRGWKG